MIKKVQTLCIIYRHPKVLLGLKKRGFGMGRWNGFGGNVEEGESVEGAARREVFEEAGITVKGLEKVGVLKFAFERKLPKPEGPGSRPAEAGLGTESFEVHLFRTSDFEGEPTESEEMKPGWFHVDELPFNKMWPDDKYWYPLFLQNKKFNGKFLFGDKGQVVKYELSEI